MKLSSILFAISLL